MNAIFRFFDLFIPATLRHNPADLMRGYVLLGLIVINILISFMVLAVLLWFLDLQQNTMLGVSLDLLSLAANLLALLLLIRTENFRLCANSLLATLAIVNIIGVQITGGYLASPVLQLSLQLPVMAFLLLGLRPGIHWLLATIGICFVLYLSAMINYGYVQLLQNQSLINAVYVLLHYTLLSTVGGALIIYELINRQLTTMLNEERNRFEHKASHDDLTGIPNRFEFFRRLENVIDEAKQRQQKVGVVYIDLDGFKPINDLLGHHFGDEALKTIAMRLRKIVRLSDTTARLGGDEFALILPGIHLPDDIETILPKVLSAVREPIRINGVDVVVKASCGVAVFPNHSGDHNTLCRYADLAMYRAKETHDAYLLFDETMKGQRALE